MVMAVVTISGDGTEASHAIRVGGGFEWRIALRTFVSRMNNQRPSASLPGPLELASARTSSNARSKSLSSGPAYPPVNRGSLIACRSEEHTSELQSLMRNSYAAFCLIKKNTAQYNNPHTPLRLPSNTAVIHTTA